jgi:hypothetical protein
MPNSYVIYNPDGSYQNCIYCEETDPIPEGCTQVLVPIGYYFNGSEIVSIDNIKTIELRAI